MDTLPPSLETLRQQLEYVQIGLALVRDQARRLQAADARGERLDAATYAADVERQITQLWSENRAICMAMNAHVAAHYARSRR